MQDACKRSSPAGQHGRVPRQWRGIDANTKVFSFEDGWHMGPCTKPAKLTPKEKERASSFTEFLNPHQSCSGKHVGSEKRVRYGYKETLAQE